MRKNIYAYTETAGYEYYPAFVSLNKESNGEYSLTVRSRNTADSSSVAMTPEQLEALATDILASIHGDA